MIASNALALIDGYAGDVTAGNVVVCRQVARAVARYLADREREGDPGFPYYFDENAAAVAIDFFGLMLTHSIGEHAGLPFFLEPWQAMGIGQIYGWKRLDDGARRFRRVFWSMARKNGKSCLASGMSIYNACFDINPVTLTPESVAQVILAAAKREQADLVTFAEVKRMRDASRHIKSRSEIKNNQVRFGHNGGTIRTVGSNKPYDGLNPSAVFLDEIHAWTETHREFYDTMRTGSGSRVQPLLVTTTTAGNDRSRLWRSEYDYACQVLAGNVTDEKLFAYIFELDADDDPLDESTWIKANPNLGVSVALDYLRDAAAPAKTDALELNRFLRFHGNRLVSSVSRAFDPRDWAACAGTLSDWDEADAIGGGIDIGSRDDFGAYSLVARFPTGETDSEDRPIWRYEIRSRAYIAQDTTRDLQKAPFAQWVHNDLLHVCKYPLAQMREDILEDCRRYYVNEIAYDPYNGQILAEDIEKEGMRIASMAQNQRHFHEPISDFSQAVKDGRLTHNGCPLLSWCVSNAVLVEDRNQHVMFSKADSAEKIDPLVSTVMAYRRAMLSPERVRGPFFTFGD